MLAGTAQAQESLVARLAAAAPAANPQVLSLATRAAECARRQGLLDGFRHLAVIDYSLPSTKPRLWVFDVAQGRLLFQERVAHGRNTGEQLVRQLIAAAPAANPQVISLATRAADCARRQGLLDGFRHLAVIDYSLPSTKPRLWVFDVARGKLLFQELVAHGRNTGEQIAERFSNVEGSKMSSLGLFQTAETYYGSNGYSLRLRGLDAGFNDNALARAIVMHGAPYVSEAIAERVGRIGRSWGCPAVRQEVARTVIDTLKGGALIFAYYPDRKWLNESPMLRCGEAQPGQTLAAIPGKTPQG
jgi:hypothetical protein